MKRLLLALMVLVSLVSMVGFSRAQIPPNLTGIEDSAFQVTTNTTTGAGTELPATVNLGAQAKAMVYYLTKNSFTGGDAITACDSGFHMASIPEIEGSSNLQYATRSTAAYDSLEDGQRLTPPSNQIGWVRTGSILVARAHYYDISMLSFDQQTGTTSSLHTQVWGDSYMDPYPADTETGWHLKQLAYNRPQPVWCVEDPE